MQNYSIVGSTDAVVCIFHTGELSNLDYVGTQVCNLNLCFYLL